MKVETGWNYIKFVSETDDEVNCLFNMYEQILTQVECECIDKGKVFELIILTSH